MNYHNITHDDMLNGPGLRVVLWVAGCDHHCPDCQNPITWDPGGGLHFGWKEFIELDNALEADYCSGITYSGGDPLHFVNRDAIECVARWFRQLHPAKTQWLYTGYLWEEVSNLPVIQHLDVIVDGKFDKNLADVRYHWAGSTNQRAIDVQKSLKSGSVVLFEETNGG